MTELRSVVKSLLEENGWQVAQRDPGDDYFTKSLAVSAIKSGRSTINAWLNGSILSISSIDENGLLDAFMIDLAEPKSLEAVEKYLNEVCFG